MFLRSDKFFWHLTQDLTISYVPRILLCHHLSLKGQEITFFYGLRSIKQCFFSLLSVVFEEPEDPTNRSFFSEIISSISDVKFSNSGRYMISRDYLSVKVWDLHMETKPIETYTVSNQIEFNCLIFFQSYYGFQFFGLEEC